MSLIGSVHLAFALASLLSGAVVLFLRKGTQRHRRLGWVYVISMLGLNLTAFSIYRLFGGFGPFHWAALISLVTVFSGVFSFRYIQVHPRRVEAHARWMTWSYVGLCAAAASETLSRVPSYPFWWLVATATGVVVLTGAVLIHVRLPATLRPFRPYSHATPQRLPQSRR